MKLTTSPSHLLIPALLYTARVAAAADAHVYMHNPQSPPRPQPHSRILSPVSARLVLAQRAGVEEFHSSDLLREEVVDAINDYGTYTSLFADQDDTARRAFILLEGQTDPKAATDSLRDFTSFILSPAPDAQSTRGLFTDLAVQVNPQQLSGLYAEDLATHLTNPKSLQPKGSGFYVAKTLDEFQELFQDLVRTKEYAITALVTPKDSTSRIAEGKFQWGTYEMPGKQSQLRKRNAARGPMEEPLAGTDENSRQAESSNAPVSSFANNTTPLRGILPACYSTKAACESATRNCTGHGSCSLKYHDPDSPGPSNGLDCFSCHCTPTQSADGKKTTIWGGPACQKKDVSVEFWLIALFTIGMIFLIGFAIGSIWEMGSEELPSVIGAGVSGPTARK